MQSACCFTYVYEVRPVLAGHAETKIPPEACVFLNHLQEGKKKKENRALKSEARPTRLSGFVQRAAAGGSTATALGAEEYFPRREDGFDWRVLPAVAPQVGCVQGFRRSEQGCTG